MIVSDKIDVTERGSEVRVRQEVVTNNLDIIQFAAMLRAMPPEQRKGFFKQCRVRAVIPMYLPKGMFRETEHFGHLVNDPDKLAYLLREAPEFSAVDDPLAPKPKLVING